jgi:hypothetical protein
MDTIIERDNGSSAAIMVVGLLALAVIAALALYFLRIYPFSEMRQQPANSVDIHVDGQVPSPVTPNPSE